MDASQTYPHDRESYGLRSSGPGFTELARPRAGRLHTIDMTTRRTPPALFFVLMLAFAVCFWGLHYKLSLYHFRTAAHGPAAKLLTQKERPSSNHLDSAYPASPQTQSPTLFPIFLIAAIAVGMGCAPSNSIWTTITNINCRQQSCVHSFCFLPRPPPAPPLPN